MTSQEQTIAILTALNDSEPLAIQIIVEQDFDTLREITFTMASLLVNAYRRTGDGIGMEPHDYVTQLLSHMGPQVAT